MFHENVEIDTNHGPLKNKDRLRRGHHRPIKWASNKTSFRQGARNVDNHLGQQGRARGILDCFQQFRSEARGQKSGRDHVRSLSLKKMDPVDATKAVRNNEGPEARHNPQLRRRDLSSDRHRDEPYARRHMADPYARGYPEDALVRAAQLEGRRDAARHERPRDYAKQPRVAVNKATATFADQDGRRYRILWNEIAEGAFDMANVPVYCKSGPKTRQNLQSVYEVNDSIVLASKQHKVMFRARINNIGFTRTRPGTKASFSGRIILDLSACGLTERQLGRPP